MRQRPFGGRYQRLANELQELCRVRVAIRAAAQAVLTGKKGAKKAKKK